MSANGNREITDEPYRYGYQGQFSEKDLTTGMQEFELRNYDARIGRWTTPDPYGQFASPYLGMASQPHLMVDPDGGCVPMPCIDLMEVVIEGSKIASTKVLPALSSAAASAVNLSQHVGNRLANGAVKTGNDVKNAYLNSGYFANSALHAITFGTWQKLEASSLQQEYLQSAGQGFGEGLHVANAASRGLSPRASPLMVTPIGNIPVTQPMVLALPTVLDLHGSVYSKVTSKVKQDSRLAKLAKETFEGNAQLSKEANDLLAQLSLGNMNPGIGTKSIGYGIFEARSRGGARVYFRNTVDGIEILGYSNKSNQQSVIDRLIKVYGL